MRGSINDSPGVMQHITLTAAVQAEGNHCLLCEGKPQLNTWHCTRQTENHFSEVNFIAVSSHFTSYVACEAVPCWMG